MVVIDQVNLDSISFTYFEVMVDEVVDAVTHNYINRSNFENSDYITIYPRVNTNRSVFIRSEYKKGQLIFVLNETIKYLIRNNEMLLIVLERFLNYIKIEKYVYERFDDIELVNTIEGIEVKLNRFMIESIVDEIKFDEVVNYLNEILLMLQELGC